MGLVLATDDVELVCFKPRPIERIARRKLASHAALAALGPDAEPTQILDEAELATAASVTQLIPEPFDSEASGLHRPPAGDDPEAQPTMPITWDTGGSSDVTQLIAELRPQRGDQKPSKETEERDPAPVVEELLDELKNIIDGTLEETP